MRIRLPLSAPRPGSKVIASIVTEPEMPEGFEEVSQRYILCALAVLALAAPKTYSLLRAHKQ